MANLPKCKHDHPDCFSLMEHKHCFALMNTTFKGDCPFYKSIEQQMEENPEWFNKYPMIRNNRRESRP